MKFLKVIFSIAIVILSFTALHGNVQQATQPQAEIRSVQMAERRGPERRSLFLLATSFGSYTVRGDGYVEAPGQYWHGHTTLPLGQKGFLVRLYFLEQQGDLILIYEISNVESGWGYAVRLNQKTLKLKWIAPVSSINIGAGLIETDSLYLSAANWLAKIDLHSGTFIWQIELQKKNGEPFDSFQPPSIDGERIRFTETYGKNRVVEVDKTTGKLLSVN